MHGKRDRDKMEIPKQVKEDSKTNLGKMKSFLAQMKDDLTQISVPLIVDAGSNVDMWAT